MKMNVLRLAWLQISSERGRFIAAVAGVSFAVVLVLVQLGLQQALFASVEGLPRAMVGDLVLVSPAFQNLSTAGTFTQRRLYQALGDPDVASVVPMYIRVTPIKNPETRQQRDIFVLGFPPERGVLDLPEVDAQIDKLKLPDRALFDRRSRKEFGPYAALLRKEPEVRTEINTQPVYVDGLFTLGTSFAADGNLVTSDINFLRFVPDRKWGAINIGLIRLRDHADVRAVQSRLAHFLPDDVQVLTHAEFVEREREYWDHSTPIGFVFQLGVIMGLIVGGVIVYQILYTDVSEHLPDYATLKAIGYRNRFLFALVMRQSLILSVCGFVPGVVIAEITYAITRAATHLPVTTSFVRLIAVYALTLAMCAGAGTFAMLKIRSADPAEVF